MKIIAFILLLSVSFCYGQKSYKFDTLLEYECRFKNLKSDSTVTQYLYTNSKNNSFSLLVRDYDSLHYSIEFLAYDKYHSTVKVIKDKLFTSAEIDILDCSTIHKTSNNYKFRVKEYDFFNLKDTLINNRLSKNYKLQYLKSKKRKKRKQIGTALYIIKDSTEFHLPILLAHATAYEEWKKERNIPNGIYQEYIFYDYNETITNHYKLKDNKKTNVTLNIVEPCPLTIKVLR